MTVEKAQLCSGSDNCGNMTKQSCAFITDVCKMCVFLLQLSLCLLQTFLTYQRFTSSKAVSFPSFAKGTHKSTCVLLTNDSHLLRICDVPVSCNCFCRSRATACRCHRHKVCQHRSVTCLRIDQPHAMYCTSMDFFLLNLCFKETTIGSYFFITCCQIALLCGSDNENAGVFSTCWLYLTAHNQLQGLFYPNLVQ